MDVDLEKLIYNLKKKDAVVSAYLFGSQRNPPTGPLSDVDIAVFFNPPLTWKEYLDWWSELSLQTGLGDQLDLINLNEADTLLQFEAIFRGKNLFTKDRKLQQDLEEKVLRDYLDTDYLRRLREEYLYLSLPRGS